MEAQLLAGISHSAILQRNSAKFYRQYQLQHNVESVEAAKRAMEVSTRPPMQIVSEHAYSGLPQ